MARKNGIRKMATGEWNSDTIIVMATLAVFGIIIKAMVGGV